MGEIFQKKLKRYQHFIKEVVLLSYLKYIAIKNVFPNARIFPCYFHLIRRLIIHLKSLRSNNSVIKRTAKNLLFNMKLLLFIDND